MKGTKSGTNKINARSTRASKLAFIGILLPVVGLIFILPPLVSMRSDTSSYFFGIPPNIAYLFGVWLVLIVGAFILQLYIPPDRADPTEQKDD